MKLVSFQIKNFRSINDSGQIKASRVTALLGRNESGKSNLLRALQSLNPPGGIKALKKVKDFPRHRRLEDCDDSTEVVSTTWELNEKELSELTGILPQITTITGIRIGRRYGDTTPWVALDELAQVSFDVEAIAARGKKLAAEMRAIKATIEDKVKSDALAMAADTFETNFTKETEKNSWAKAAMPILSEARTALAAGGASVKEKVEVLMGELESTASGIVSFDSNQQQAKKWILDRLPVFIFLEEYPSLCGHQNIAEYLARKAASTLTDADRNFEKLCKVAALNPEELEAHLAQGDQETRNQLANRASSVVTQEVRRLWKDRPLRIRFNVDASHFDTFVSDPNAVFDVEVNLDERSRGFQWFLSFYITFAADTKGGVAANAILLLDEPGLYLHAKSQSDLLSHFESDFVNQIIYTTHSPFMVPTHNLDSIRTVSITEHSGTTVTNDPSGDSRTLFPLQAALGYDLSQSLFVGGQNLVVEGVTDYWILSSVSAYLRDSGKSFLSSELTITPAGGAQKVSYMVALLSSEELNVLVLLDDERDAKSTRDALVRSRLIDEYNVIFVSEGIESKPSEADIEDLLDENVFKDLILESYAKELEGKTLNPNPNIPRIAKRYELALKELGIEFFKTRPVRLFLQKIAVSPKEIVTPETERRFVSLIEVINTRFKKLVDSGRPPFR